MSKHTPGSWEFMQEPEGFEILGGGKEYTIGTVYGAEDARLIAAAPEMLGALKKALGLLQQNLEYNRGSASQVLRGAIAKAEGRT